MNPRSIAVALALGLLFCSPAAALDPKPGEGGDKLQDFSFYGLHFRMTRDQVARIFMTNEQSTEVNKPGHGMMFLTLGYDDKDRLMEIRAAYAQAGDPLVDEGRRRAIREKFVQPLGRYKNLSVTLDEYGNRAAFTLVIVSQDLREEAISRHKEELLKLLE
jgi:hypothetical protein